VFEQPTLEIQKRLDEHQLTAVTSGGDNHAASLFRISGFRIARSEFIGKRQYCLLEYDGRLLA